VLGVLIGLERQLRDKPAGLRTNMLICVGATQFMVISTKAAEIFGGDPVRISAQIITGIGFLGAGAVLHSSGFVVGLTTAATIWVVAGVGMALGAGMYGIAIATTVLTLATLYFMSMVEHRLHERHQFMYEVLVSDLNQGLASVNRILGAQRLVAADVSFKKENQNYRVQFHVITTTEGGQHILQGLSQEAAIHEVDSLSHTGEL